MNLEQIVNKVSAETGLEKVTVVDQLLAEQGSHINGPFFPDANNPFNIGPHHHYASVEEGADAYIHLINTAPQYAGVRKAALSDSAPFELQALSRSPYDANHYGNKDFGGTGNKLLADYPEAVSIVSKFSPDDANVQAYNQTSQGLADDGILGAFAVGEKGIATDTAKGILDLGGIGKWVWPIFGLMLVLLAVYMLIGR